jgi:hypothetical protein
MRAGTRRPRAAVVLAPAGDDRLDSDRRDVGRLYRGKSAMSRSPSRGIE